MYALRPYQTKAISSVDSLFSTGTERVVMVSPTGSGKTVIARAIIQNMVAAGKNILFLAHRRELINQCSTKLSEFNIKHGVIMSTDPRHDIACQVQVASVQSLARRAKPPADLIIVDEGHRSLADGYLDIFGAYPDARILAMTATPWRTDGQGLGLLYQSMVVVAQADELITEGYLVAPVVYAPHRPDLGSIKIARGDYVTSQLSGVMNNHQLTGNIVETWKRLSPGKRTVVFACNVDHSENIISEFIGAGVPAAHLDHTTSDSDRDLILGGLRDGHIQVVSNVGILTEGWDLPALETAIIARPTLSTALYLQMVGRIMRPAYGKTKALVIDHAGCVYEHGSPDQRREFNLESLRQGHGAPTHRPCPIKVCKQCSLANHTSARVCSGCGNTFDVGPHEVDGDLVEAPHIPVCKRCGQKVLRRSRSDKTFKYAAKYYCKACRFVDWVPDAKAKGASSLEREMEKQRLLAYGRAHGFSQSWAEYRFKEIFR